VTDLAITARCQNDDLPNLPPDDATHLVNVFAERRGQNPEGGEEMKGLGGPLYKLHADLSGGRDIRGITWYDRGADVCWLLAGGRHDVYARVEQLAKTDSHWPTSEDWANFEADAPIRLIERVVRNARTSLEEAMKKPGAEVPLTLSPPPAAFFQIDGERLWLRATLFAHGRRQLTQKQVAALWAAVFGKGIPQEGHPEHGGRWDSIYLVGPIPDLESWPPAKSLL